MDSQSQVERQRQPLANFCDCCNLTVCLDSINKFCFIASRPSSRFNVFAMQGSHSFILGNDKFTNVICVLSNKVQMLVMRSSMLAKVKGKTGRSEGNESEVEEVASAPKEETKKRKDGRPHSPFHSPPLASCAKTPFRCISCSYVPSSATTPS